MQTHDDREHWRRLETEAERMMKERLADITAGAPGEEPLREWEKYGVTVREFPEREVDTPLDLVRVSIGGVAHGEANYCVFRGPIVEVKAVLRAALNALREAP